MNEKQEKNCVICGTRFPKPSGVHGKAWKKRQTCGRECWSALRSELTTKQMSDPAARKHLSVVVAAQHKKEGNRARFKMTPEIAEKISASQRGCRRKWMDNPYRNEKIRAKMAKTSARRFYEIGKENHVLFRSDVREKAIANSVAEGKTNPLRGKFESNIHADEWHLRSPFGRDYHFNNLCHFIRNHRDLFSARQLEPRGKCGKTRIESCLRQLSPRNKHPVTCSQGWTWIKYPHEPCPITATNDINNRKNLKNQANHT